MSMIDRVHEFWFEHLNDTDAFTGKDPAVRKWFIKNADFDSRIKEEFENLIQQANQGQLDHWKESAQGCLSWIILLDQFPRNIYRNTPQMFSFDAKALAGAQQCISDQADRQLMLVERIFLYMPFQHAEDLSIQELSLKCFSSLIEEAKEKSPQNVSYYEYTYNYARKHYDVIAQFGRFPHRNKIVKRESTPEEEKYLSQPGAGF